MLDKESVAFQDVKKRASSKLHSPEVVDEQIKAFKALRKQNIKVVTFVLLKVHD